MHFKIVTILAYLEHKTMLRRRLQGPSKHPGHIFSAADASNSLMNTLDTGSHIHRKQFTKLCKLVYPWKKVSEIYFVNETHRSWAKHTLTHHHQGIPSQSSMSLHVHGVYGVTVHMSPRCYMFENNSNSYLILHSFVKWLIT